MEMQNVIYRDNLKFTSGLIPFWIGFSLLFIIMGILGLIEAPSFGAYASFGLGLFLALYCWCLSPNKYLIMEDRLRIVFGSGIKKT
jgi:hypothetical protein